MNPNSVRWPYFRSQDPRPLFPQATGYRYPYGHTGYSSNVQSLMNLPVNDAYRQWQPQNQPQNNYNSQFERHRPYQSLNRQVYYGNRSLISCTQPSKTSETVRPIPNSTHLRAALSQYQDYPQRNRSHRTLSCSCPQSGINSYSRNNSAESSGQDTIKTKQVGAQSESNLARRGHNRGIEVHDKYRKLFLQGELKPRAFRTLSESRDHLEIKEFQREGPPAETQPKQRGYERKFAKGSEEQQPGKLFDPETAVQSKDSKTIGGNKTSEKPESSTRGQVLSVGNRPSRPYTSSSTGSQRSDHVPLKGEKRVSSDKLVSSSSGGKSQGNVTGSSHKVKGHQPDITETVVSTGHPPTEANKYMDNDADEPGKVGLLKEGLTEEAGSATVLTESTVHSELLVEENLPKKSGLDNQSSTVFITNVSDVEKQSNLEQNNSCAWDAASSDIEKSLDLGEACCGEASSVRDSSTTTQRKDSKSEEEDISDPSVNTVTCDTDKESVDNSVKLPSGEEICSGASSGDRVDKLANGGDLNADTEAENSPPSLDLKPQELSLVPDLPTAEVHNITDPTGECLKEAVSSTGGPGTVKTQEVLTLINSSMDKEEDVDILIVGETKAPDVLFVSHEPGRAVSDNRATVTVGNNRGGHDTFVVMDNKEQKTHVMPSRSGASNSNAIVIDEDLDDIDLPTYLVKEELKVEEFDFLLDLSDNDNSTSKGTKKKHQWKQGLHMPGQTSKCEHTKVQSAAASNSHKQDRSAIIICDDSEDEELEVLPTFSGISFAAREEIEYRNSQRLVSSGESSRSSSGPRKRSLVDASDTNNVVMDVNCEQMSDTEFINLIDEHLGESCEVVGTSDSVKDKLSAKTNFTKVHNKEDVYESSSDISATTSRDYVNTTEQVAEVGAEPIVNKDCSDAFSQVTVSTNPDEELEHTSRQEICEDNSQNSETSTNHDGDELKETSCANLVSENDCFQNDQSLEVTPVESLHEEDDGIILSQRHIIHPKPAPVSGEDLALCELELAESHKPSQTVVEEAPVESLHDDGDGMILSQKHTMHPKSVPISKENSVLCDLEQESYEPSQTVEDHTMNESPDIERSQQMSSDEEEELGFTPEIDDKSDGKMSSDDVYFVQDNFLDDGHRSALVLSDDSSDDDLFGVDSVFSNLKSLSVRAAPSTPTKLSGQADHTMETVSAPEGSEDEETSSFTTQLEHSTVEPHQQMNLDTLLQDKIKRDQEKEDGRRIDYLKAHVESGYVDNWQMEDNDDNGECTDLMEEHKIQLEKLKVEDHAIMDQHPGEMIFDQKLYRQIFDESISPADCGFVGAEGSRDMWENKINTLPQEVLTELLRLGVFNHSSFSNPSPFFTWTLHLLSVHGNDIVIEKCEKLLYHYMSYNQAPNWVPTLKDICRIFVNYGCTCETLYPRFNLHELSFQDYSSQNIAHVPRGNSCYGFRNMQAIARVLTTIVKHRHSLYTRENLVDIILILIKVSLDRRLYMNMLRSDFYTLISVIVEVITTDQWEEACRCLCSTLPHLSVHHHNVVYVAEMFSHTTRGRTLQRRVALSSLQLLLDLRQSCTTITDTTVKLREILQTVGSIVLKNSSDFYRISSLLSLLDLSVGNEGLKADEKDDLMTLKDVVRGLSGDVRETLGVLDRTLIKDKIVRLTSKWQFMLLNMGTKQSTLFDWARSSQDEYTQELIIETVGGGAMDDTQSETEDT